MPLQQGKIKGIADVVFVLDVSESMKEVLDAVKRHIDDFVAGVNSSSNSHIDLRLGLVAQPTDVQPWCMCHPFTADKEEFRQALASAQLSPLNELTLCALDKALDYPWRPQGRRFVILFTDEPIANGHIPEVQRSKVEELKLKMNTLHIHGYFVGPACPSFDALGKQAPRMVRVVLEPRELYVYDFARFLGDMGRTVSVTSESVAPVSFNPDLYKLVPGGSESWNDGSRRSAQR